MFTYIIIFKPKQCRLRGDHPRTTVKIIGWHYHFLSIHNLFVTMSSSKSQPKLIHEWVRKLRKNVHYFDRSFGRFSYFCMARREWHLAGDSTQYFLCRQWAMTTMGSSNMTTMPFIWCAIRHLLGNFHLFFAFVDSQLTASQSSPFQISYRLDNKRSLNSISQSIRFLANGVLAQVIFMTGYNLSVVHFEPLGYPASTIYAVFYLLYIPLGHALQSLIVFGWPDNYLPSLLSNAPIGLTAMAIGTMLTGFLSRMEFNAMAEDWISYQFGNVPPEKSEEEGEFYSSLVVMVVTGAWGYVLSQYINSAKPEEKGAPTARYEKDPAKEL